MRTDGHMRQPLGILSVATLSFMGLVALVNTTGDPGPVLVFPRGVARVMAALTLWYGIASSLQGRQFALFGGLLAAGVVGIVGLVVTLLIPVYPNQMLGGIQLVSPVGL